MLGKDPSMASDQSAGQESPVQKDRKICGRRKKKYRTKTMAFPAVAGKANNNNNNNNK